VIEGDRLDLITARTLSDPEQFWRIADANDAMDPTDLTNEPGSRLRIATPQAEGTPQAGAEPEGTMPTRVYLTLLRRPLPVPAPHLLEPAGVRSARRGQASTAR